MRFENLVIEDIDLYMGNGQTDGNFCCPATDELVDITNKIRKEQGNADLVTVDDDNEVYYNFYLYFNTDTKEIKLESVCNHGKKDDYVSYRIELTQEEKMMLMFKIIKYLVEED